MQTREVQSVVEFVVELKTRLPLVRRADKLTADNKDTNFLLSLLLAELKETEAELALSGTEHFSRSHLAGEISDMLVFAVSLQLSKGRSLADLYSNTSKINGQGTRSAALEIVADLVENSQDDPRALLEAFTIIMSLLHHFSPISVIDSMQKTIAKVLANRPQELYTDSEHGVLLSDSEAIQKYEHLERGMRLIRATVCRTLLPQDWKPYVALLHNWRESQLSLTTLEARLAVFQRNTTSGGVLVPNAAQVAKYAN